MSFNKFLGFSWMIVGLVNVISGFIGNDMTLVQVGCLGITFGSVLAINEEI